MCVSQSKTPLMSLMVSSRGTEASETSPPSGYEIVPEIPDVDLHVGAVGRVVVPRHRIAVGEECERRARVGIHEPQLVGRTTMPERARPSGSWRPVTARLALDRTEEPDVGGRRAAAVGLLAERRLGDADADGVVDGLLVPESRVVQGLEE